MKNSNYDNLHIVGLGASAGGFEALQKFIERVEPNDNIAYVIVQHLDPNQPTMLGNLLGKFSRLPIKEIHEKITPQANCIYFCPPNKHLTIKDEKFYLTVPQARSYPKPSVDKFFESLAKEKKEYAVGVILSGTGSDGAKGIEFINKYGGITIAEDEGAKYFSMPKAAIDTGVIDAVITPELIAEGIPKAIKDRKYFLAQYEVKGSIEKVFSLIDKKTNIDFSSYKENTILRRLKKRMSETKNADIDEYIEYLKNNKEELETLKNELLIIVTSFFRGEDAFKELEKHLTKLIEEKEDDSFRIWIPACATGEEVYTIAIILKEIFEKIEDSKKVTIFATDVSEIAIDSARTKVYSSEEMAGVSEKFINKYFEKHNTGFKPKKFLRDMIVFSKHNVIKDPPFSKLDLVSCRNLLIYFNSNLQKKIMSIFYYSLRFGGLLFLGQSETVGSLGSFFSTIHSKNKLFKKTSDIPDATPDLIDYTRYSNFMAKPKSHSTEKVKISDIGFSISKALAKEYGKNGVVIDSTNHNILYYRGDPTEYIKQKSGMPTQDIFKLVKDYLKLDLRATINESKKTNKTARSKKIRVYPSGNIDFYVLILVFPLEANKLGEDTLFIIFEKIEEKNLISKDKNKKPVDNSEVTMLEDELASLKERLQITIEELETSNEELQSTNEELQSTNEELQSTNEELETSNEELQSTNEELQTVNDELNFKNVELEFNEKAFNDVLTSINTDVLIIDSSLNILKYTEGVSKFFDIDKTNLDNFSNILMSSSLVFPNLLEDLRKCLKENKKIEYQVNLSNKVYLFRISKIITGISHTQGEETGLVLSFLDRTEFFEKDKLLFQQSKMASMGEMIGNIAHQWRQPLNVLGINIASLIDKIDNDSLDDKYLQKFKELYKKEINLMSSTIDDFKDFFKPSKEYELISLNEVLRQSLSMIDDSFKFNSIEIDKKSTKYKFYGSKNELSQVLINILTNAKDALLENKKENRVITIRTTKKAQHIILSIKDNGGGVTQEVLGKLGQAYFTTKNNNNGTGIGLYMSKIILEKMRGDIEFVNHKSEGLEVKLYLCENKDVVCQ